MVDGDPKLGDVGVAGGSVGAGYVPDGVAAEGDAGAPDTIETSPVFAPDGGDVVDDSAGGVVAKVGAVYAGSIPVSAPAEKTTRRENTMFKRILDAVIGTMSSRRREYGEVFGQYRDRNLDDKAFLGETTLYIFEAEEVVIIDLEGLGTALGFVLNGDFIEFVKGEYANGFYSTEAIITQLGNIVFAKGILATLVAGSYRDACEDLKSYSGKSSPKAVENFLAEMFKAEE
ncbi:MAG: hypothetical protein WC285_04980 [Candidatus Gracilibacteria bacterium]|jgi:hypothetical protein